MVKLDLLRNKEPQQIRTTAPRPPPPPPQVLQFSCGSSIPETDFTERDSVQRGAATLEPCTSPKAVHGKRC